MILSPATVFEILFEFQDRCTLILLVGSVVYATCVVLFFTR